MDAEKQLMTRVALEAQLVEYWHDVDTNWGRNAGKYYTDDAIFDGGEAVYRGRAKIEEFYSWRLARGPRVAVHAFTNFRIAFETDTELTSTWYLLLYAADGVPKLPTHPPISIALVTDTVQCQADGRWLYTSRRFQTLFAGGTPPTNPNLDSK